MNSLTLSHFNHAGKYRGIEAQNRAGRTVFTASIGDVGKDYAECKRYAKKYEYPQLVVGKELLALLLAAGVEV